MGYNLNVMRFKMHLSLINDSRFIPNPPFSVFFSFKIYTTFTIVKCNILTPEPFDYSL